jgi:hypothetical protein
MVGASMWVPIISWLMPLLRAACFYLFFVESEIPEGSKEFVVRLWVVVAAVFLNLFFIVLILSVIVWLIRAVQVD